MNLYEKTKDFKIAIGGMIASGKSTLAEALSKRLDLPLIEEFKSDDTVFNTLLSWLYEDYEDTEMLLQVYFLHNHYKRQRELKHTGYVVDREMIEHWLFAQANLKHMPEILNMYNGVFHAYMNKLKKPDLYVILDIDWDTFKERLFERGRPQEVDNFEAQEEYFKTLLTDYTDKLMAQCVIYDIPYIIVNSKDNLEDKLNTIEKHVDRLKRFKA